MKTLQYKNISLLLASLLILFTACERDLDDDLPLATYATTSEIFLDTPVGLGSNFYFPYGGAKPTAWSVDNSQGYNSSASMRIDVPNANDPEGGYAGGILRIDGAGRNLTGYDALTFWAKASQGVTIAELGFGEDFGANAYMTTLYGTSLSTSWQKIIIPIPDASKLTQERGMFRFAASGIGDVPGQEVGYTFWIDELKFEKLGTVAQPRPKIMNGEDATTSGANGSTYIISGLTETFNLANGQDVTVGVASGYYEFNSSDPSAASVDASGVVTILSQGTSVITATLGGIDAQGSLTVTSNGDFVHAPTPTYPAEDVISIFSDAYENVPVDFYNGYWEPYQTTLSEDFTVGDDNILNYTNFNFVGTQFSSPTIDASGMTQIHFDLFFPAELPSDASLTITLKDFGSNGTDGGEDDILQPQTFSASELTSGAWNSIDIPLSISDRTHMGQIIYEGNNISNFYVDNIYFYDSGDTGGTEGPQEAAPTPMQDAANVISIYSDAYTNLEGTDYPDWGQTTMVSEMPVAGNNTLLFAGLNYQGIQFASAIDATSMDYLHIDYWTENSTEFNTYLISTGPVETPYTLTVPTEGWNSVDIPLSAFSPVDLADIIQMKFDGNGDIYLDNIYFYADSGSGATEPTMAAPTPTWDAANVISLFSDAYTDVPVDTWRTDWSSADYQEVSVAGNATKLYSNLDFVGIETVANTIDASGMTHFHIDVWTPNAEVFSIKLVDFGADGAYDGGDDSEHQIDFTSPAQGQWISYDIPLSDFAGLASSAHMAQYILVAQPSGTSTVYVDNVYFHN